MLNIGWENELGGQTLLDAVWDDDGDVLVDVRDSEEGTLMVVWGDGERCVVTAGCSAQERNLGWGEHVV